MQDSVLQSGWCHWSLQNAIMNGFVDSVNRFCIQLDAMYFVDGGICYLVIAAAVFVF
jgi:hypothetical protein